MKSDSKKNILIGSCDKNVKNFPVLSPAAQQSSLLNIIISVYKNVCLVIAVKLVDFDQKILTVCTKMLAIPSVVYFNFSDQGNVALA